MFEPFKHDFMKFLLTLIITSMMLISCKNGEEAPLITKKGQVSFSFAFNESNESGRLMNSIPTGSVIQLSIEALDGTEVLTREQVGILSFNHSYATEPIELVEDAYILTEFLILNSEGDVLYATPISGSPKEDLVNISLPFSFSVVSNDIAQFSMEVLDVSTLTPEDIGYASLSFKITNHFFLSVFQTGKDGTSLTDAQGYILLEGDTIRNFSTEAEINSISFPGDDKTRFTLVIIKSGFAKYSKEWTIQEIKDNSDNAIVSVTLIPALTFVALPTNKAGSNFEFSLSFPDDIIIDWGDGEIDSISGITGHATFEHTYSNVQSYFVSVTSDADKVEGFSSYYGYGPLANINLQHLPFLRDFRYGFSGKAGMSPLVLDFTHNPKLEILDVSSNPNLDKVIISDINNLISIDLHGLENISTIDLGEFVDALYSSVVANNRMNGSLNLASEAENGEIVLTGPPSEATLAKFRILRDQYDWLFYFDLGEERIETNLQAYVRE